MNLVELSGRNRAINEVEIVRKDELVERNLVILHGYGAGLGLFYRYFHPFPRVMKLLDFDFFWVSVVWRTFKLMVGILMV